MYDVNVKRVAKVKKIFEKYLFHIQNSTFEGMISEKKLNELQYQLKQVIQPQEDQVIFFIMSSSKLMRKQVLGLPSSYDIDTIF
ncbi:CRISPR-associated endonuclease Cas2 [Laceyella putida]|uniref:CRISPR-associated endonuclease Cas2 n=1 Tax=Laceyella putida TaxID=110101 RepID=A0ABW2RQU5_9BACL